MIGDFLSKKKTKTFCNCIITYVGRRKLKGITKSVAKMQDKISAEKKKETWIFNAQILIAQFFLNTCVRQRAIDIRFLSREMSLIVHDYIVHHLIFPPSLFGRVFLPTTNARYFTDDTSQYPQRNEKRDSMQNM